MVGLGMKEKKLKDFTYESLCEFLDESGRFACGGYELEVDESQCFFYIRSITCHTLPPERVEANPACKDHLKFHIAIKDDHLNNLKLAWNVLCPIMMDEKIYDFKVIKPNQTRVMLEEKGLLDEDQIGKEICIYCDENPEISCEHASKERKAEGDSSKSNRN